MSNVPTSEVIRAWREGVFVIWGVILPAGVLYLLFDYVPLLSVFETHVFWYIKLDFGHSPRV